jgi:hypothetical protein
VLSIPLLLSREEAESLAAALARVVMDENALEQEREVAERALREIERARVATALRPRKNR